MTTDVVIAILLPATVCATAIWIESKRRHRRTARAAEHKRRKRQEARSLREPESRLKD